MRARCSASSTCASTEASTLGRESACRGLRSRMDRSLDLETDHAEHFTVPVRPTATQGRVLVAADEGIPHLNLREPDRISSVLEDVNGQACTLGGIHCNG